MLLEGKVVRRAVPAPLFQQPLAAAEVVSVAEQWALVELLAAHIPEALQEEQALETVAPEQAGTQVLAGLVARGGLLAQQAQAVLVVAGAEVVEGHIPV